MKKIFVLFFICLWGIQVISQDYTLSLRAEPENGGSLNQSGSGVYYEGDTVFILSLPNPGFNFVNWEIDGVEISDEQNFRYVMPDHNVEIVANFSLASYNINLSAVPESAGSVSQTGDGVYEYGEIVNFSATANSGYVFLHWLVDNEFYGTMPSFNYMMPAYDVDVEAYFTCHINSFPFIETFENNSPTRYCWLQFFEEGQNHWSFQQGSNGGNVQNAYHGNLNARFTQTTLGGPFVTKLVSPVMDLSSLNNPLLSFWYAQEATFYGSQNELKVYYRKSSDSDWIEIFSDSENRSSWTYVDFYLPEPGSFYQLAFEGIDRDGRANVLDLITVGEAPTCREPDSLEVTDITTNSAYLHWNPIGFEDRWNVQYGEEGFALGSGYNLYNLNADSVLVTSLNPATIYEFYVQAQCYGETSQWVGPYSFVTYCDVLNNFPFIETFENNSNTRHCWTQIFEQGERRWTFAEGAIGGEITEAYSGNLNARFTGFAVGTQRTKLVSPKLDLSSLNTPLLSFWYAQESTPVGTQNELKVFYRTSPNSDWVEIFHDDTEKKQWTQVKIILPEPDSTYQVAFEGIDNNGMAVVLDEIIIQENPTYMLVLQSKPENAAQVSGGGTILDGHTVELSAVANEEKYLFNFWSEGYDTVSMIENFEYTMPSRNTVLVANYYCLKDEYPFVETFNDNSTTRACWSQEFVRGTNEWVFAKGADGGSINDAFIGEKNARFKSNMFANTVSRLKSPIFNLELIDQPTLSFWFAQEAFVFSQNYLRVLYRNSADGEWIELYENRDNINNWTHVELGLPNPTDFYQIAFEANDHNGRDIVIDHVIVTGIEKKYLKLNIDDSEGSGIVTGEGWKTPGEQVLILAIPDPDNSFVGWYYNDELYTSNQSYYYTMPDYHVEKTAKFLYNFTGVVNNELNDFTIYPNPAKDILFISDVCNNVSIRIFDINGKLILTETNFDKSEINISDFTAGTYIVVITNEKGETGVKKFVKE